MVRSRSIRLLVVIAVLIGLNIAGQYWYKRFDFTKEGRFTLSAKTLEVLNQPVKEIKVTVFLDGDLPSAFKRLKNAVQDLLADYKANSKTDFKIVFADPISGLPQEEQDTVISHLYRIGVEPTSLNIKTDNGFTQKTIFPMAVVQCDNRQIPVKLLQNQAAAGGYEENINNSIQNLEYAFTSAIKKVVTGENPRIGFTESNGEPSDAYLDDAIKSLSESYETGRVNLKLIDQAGLDKLKVLFIVKPREEFSEAEKYKINYFVMKGGRVVWSIDQVSADLDSLKGKGEQLAFNNKLGLDDQLFTYGARINYNLVADANCVEIPLAMGSAQQIQLAPWVYYPLMLPDSASDLVKNIDAIRGEFSSTVDTIGVKGVKKQIILRSSAFNKVHNTPMLLALQTVAERPDPRDYASTPKTLGVLLEGRFPSLFLNRGLPEGISVPFETTGLSQATKMVVIGDGDIFKNQVSAKDGSGFPLGFDRYTQQNFGNKSLLLNIADYLVNDDNLIELRNKEVKIRLLDKTKVHAERLKWQLLNVVFPILVLISFAIFQHYYRKRKYAR